MSKAASSARPRHILWVSFLSLIFLLTSASNLHADRVRDLSKALTKSKSTKARIAAALSLGRLHNKRSFRPFINALRDNSKSVRSLAALALGELGDSRALPALRRATHDKAANVRKRATKAIRLIRKKSMARSDSDTPLNPKRSLPKKRQAYYRVQGKESPRLSPRRPELLVRIRSVVDNSKKRISKKTRKSRANTIRSLVSLELAAAKRLTTNTALASQYQLPTYEVDISVTKLARVNHGPWTEVRCELRITISNAQGKIISFLTGGAKAQVPRKDFRREYEANMQKEALENAVKSVQGDLVQYLLKTVGA